MIYWLAVLYMAKTIRVSEKTHKQLTQLAKWGQPLEEVIINLLKEHGRKSHGEKNNKDNS